MNLGKQLHKLGHFAFEHPKRIISFWVVILSVLGVSAALFFQSPNSSLSIPGTKAQQAIDRIGTLFPDSGGGTGRIVFHTENGTIEDSKAKIDELINKVGKVDGVSQAVSPFIDPSFVSSDKTIGYSQVQLDEQTNSISEKTLDDVTKVVNETRSSNLQIELGGDLVSQQPGELLGVGEIVGVGVALIVLVVTLGSLIAGGMPIASALLSIAMSMAGLFALSRVVDINSTTPVLAIMLGLAVGIDYALFIVNKHRTLALAGYSYKDAASRALGTAGNAVVFAAFTVIIALAALTVIGIPFITAMGLVGASSIAVAALVALTLIPALLGIAGDKVFNKKQRIKVEAAQKTGPVDHHGVHTNTFWHKWGSVVTAKPLPLLLTALVLIAVVALPVKSMYLGLPTDQYASTESTERKAYDLLTEGFGVGFNGPLVIVAEKLPAVTEEDKNAVRSAAMKQFEQQVAEAAKKSTAEFQQQLASATTSEQKLALQQSAAMMQAEGEVKKQAALKQIETSVQQNAKYIQLNKVATNIAKLNNVEKAQPALVTNDGTAGIIQVIPKTAPTDQKTKDLIANLRNAKTIQDLSSNGKLELGVTGAAALQEDINEKLANALPVYLVVIVGLSLLLLLIAFRSIIIPLKATLGFILSVLAMFGAMVAVFQWGWFGITDAPGPIVSFIPIVSAGILFGLAMDYEFFLVSGMREAFSHGKDAKESVVEGFSAGAKVVTAAAIIMISVFAGFITNHEAVIQTFGFGLAVGILVDAFLVRMTIVPALMSLIGNSVWWIPKWLDKRLPHVSIEGEDK